MNSVTELEPDRKSLVGSMYDDPDYRDRFSVDARRGQYHSVDEVANDWFIK